MVETLQVGQSATPARCSRDGGVLTEIVESETNPRGYIKRQRVRIECVIDSYWYAGRIDENQRRAALKFREIYLRVNCAYNARVLSDLVLIDSTRPAYSIPWI